MSRPRRLNLPQRARVTAGSDGRPVLVGGREVEAVRESWLVEDRWWTDRPLRRRYWEVVTLDGRDLVVFRELTGGGWYRHR
jgi:CO dehydrogenase/acetyl-CoA synthase delta subunit